PPHDSHPPPPRTSLVHAGSCLRNSISCWTRLPQHSHLSMPSYRLTCARAARSTIQDRSTRNPPECSTAPTWLHLLPSAVPAPHNPAPHRLPHFSLAVARLGTRRRNSHHHYLTIFHGQPRRGLDPLPEAFLVGDYMVRGKHADDRVGIATLQDKCRQSHRRRG